MASKFTGLCSGAKFESFSQGHPEFPEKYPYFNRNAIKFDHGSHLKKHFENPKFTAKAPASCLGCHQVDISDREVRPQSFEKICADCPMFNFLSDFSLSVITW